jgi:cyclic pyranopterin phosphate synthase
MAELGAVVFPFEDTGDDWSFMPLAARRALDRAGFRLSLEGWQSLTLTDRRRLVVLGADDVVDEQGVESVVRRSAHPAQAIKPVGDPDPHEPPEQLGDRRPIDAAIWSDLRAIDRYALVHVLRRSIAHDDPSRFDRALVAIVPGVARAYGIDLDPRVGSEAVPASRRPSSIPPPAARRASSTTMPAVGSVAASPGLHRNVAPSGSRSTPPPAAGRRSTTEFQAVEAGHGAPREGMRRPSTSEFVAAGPVSARPSTPPPRTPTHLDESGQARMVDVGDKPITHRKATAAGTLRMRPETALAVAKNDVPKGEVLATARIAGILAAKRTSELIPLCHPVATSKVEVLLDVEASAGRIHVTSVVEAHDRTGVEMEALTAVTVACLTVYDMLKGIDREIVIGDVRLLAKSGGRSGPYVRPGG